MDLQHTDWYICKDGKRTRLLIPIPELREEILDVYRRAGYTVTTEIWQYRPEHE